MAEKPFGSLSCASTQQHQPPCCHKCSSAPKLKAVYTKVKTPAVCCSSGGAGVNLLLPRQPGITRQHPHQPVLDPRGSAPPLLTLKCSIQTKTNPPAANSHQAQDRLLRRLLGAFLGQQKLSSWDAEFAKPLGTCMLNSAPACGSGGMSRMWLRSLHLPQFGVFPSSGMVAKSKRKPQQGGVERLGRQPSLQQGEHNSARKVLAKL